jgi:hypothetical protein
MSGASNSEDYEEHSGERMSAGRKSPEKSKRTNWAAILLVILLVAAAFVYFFAVPQSQEITFNFPTITSTTKTSASTYNSAVIKSANTYKDALRIDIKNTGTAWMKSLTVADICTPGFTTCYSYKTLSGDSLTQTFILAPKAEFVDTILAACVVPVPSCTYYHPVAHFSYYYKITFNYQSGASVTLPVTMTAINTAPFQGAYVALQSLTYSLDTFSKNSSGRLAVDIFVRSDVLSVSNSSAQFIASLNTRVGTNSFNHVLLSKEAGCADGCPAGNMTIVKSFSTVHTGLGTPVYPMPYLLLVRDLTVHVEPVFFAVWIPKLSN